MSPDNCGVFKLSKMGHSETYLFLCFIFVQQFGRSFTNLRPVRLLIVFSISCYQNPFIVSCSVVVKSCFYVVSSGGELFLKNEPYTMKFDCGVIVGTMLYF